MQSYLDALVTALEAARVPLVSLVLFGSAAQGATTASSDVDLIAVLEDGAPSTARAQALDVIAAVERAHGFRPATEQAGGAFRRFVDRAVANALSSFACSRDDLLSGDVARILSLRPGEALLVDRIVLASILGGAVTVWGEDLLPRVAIPPVRPLDARMAGVTFICQLLFSGALYPLLPDATRYAMGTLKRSLHSCHVCVRGRPAPLGEEIALLAANGDLPAIPMLLELRARYRRSFVFVLRCMPTVVRLHMAAARHLRAAHIPTGTDCPRPSRVQE